LDRFLHKRCVGQDCNCLAPPATIYYVFMTSAGAPVVPDLLPIATPVSGVQDLPQAVVAVPAVQPVALEVKNPTALQADKPPTGGPDACTCCRRRATSAGQSAGLAGRGGYHAGRTRAGAAFARKRNPAARACRATCSTLACAANERGRTDFYCQSGPTREWS